jgi:hypothetical protein
MKNGFLFVCATSNQSIDLHKTQFFILFLFFKLAFFF